MVEGESQSRGPHGSGLDNTPSAVTAHTENMQHAGLNLAGNLASASSNPFKFVSSIHKKGVLLKQGTLLSTWNLRYFLLDGALFKQFTDEGATVPSYTLNLASCAIDGVFQAADNEIEGFGELWTFTIRYPLTGEMATDNPAEMGFMHIGSYDFQDADEWYDALFAVQQTLAVQRKIYLNVLKGGANMEALQNEINQAVVKYPEGYVNLRHSKEVAQKLKDLSGKSGALSAYEAFCVEQKLSDFGLRACGLTSDGNGRIMKTLDGLVHVARFLYEGSFSAAEIAQGLMNKVGLEPLSECGCKHTLRWYHCNFEKANKPADSTPNLAVDPSSDSSSPDSASASKRAQSGGGQYQVKSELVSTDSVVGVAFGVPMMILDRALISIGSEDKMEDRPSFIIVAGSSKASDRADIVSKAIRNPMTRRIAPYAKDITSVRPNYIAWRINQVGPTSVKVDYEVSWSGRCSKCPLLGVVPAFALPAYALDQVSGLMFDSMAILFENLNRNGSSNS